MKKSFVLPWPAYACDWCETTNALEESDPFALIALASFLPHKRNELLLVSLDDLESSNFQAASPVVQYKMAATKAAFCPAKKREGDILAVAGSDIGLYKVNHNRLEHVASLASATALKRHSIASEGVILPENNVNSNHSTNSPAPITSVSWSAVDPNLLLSASYDTTCTIWNVETCSIRTQLIAHDKEVFDVSFSPIRSDSFVSVGAEGSLRMFDTRYTIHSNFNILRNLEHSTILFETKDATPLVRLAWNPNDPRYLACFGLDATDVNIIDTRSPAVPVAALPGHANVSCCRWAPHSSNHLMTTGIFYSHAR